MYQVDLKDTFNITAVGLALLRGKEQPATVEYSLNGTGWPAPVVNYVDTMACSPALPACMRTLPALLT